jgi:hypothetical protein
MNAVSREEVTRIYSLVQSLSHNDLFELNRTGFDSIVSSLYPSHQEDFFEQYFTFWKDEGLSTPELGAQVWEV